MRRARHILAREAPNHLARSTGVQHPLVLTTLHPNPDEIPAAEPPTLTEPAVPQIAETTVSIPAAQTNAPAPNATGPPPPIPASTTAARATVRAAATELTDRQIIRILRRQRNPQRTLARNREGQSSQNTAARTQRRANGPSNIPSATIAHAAAQPVEQPNPASASSTTPAAPAGDLATTIVNLRRRANEVHSRAQAAATQMDQITLSLQNARNALSNTPTPDAVARTRMRGMINDLNVEFAEATNAMLEARLEINGLNDEVRRFEGREEVIAAMAARDGSGNAGARPRVSAPIENAIRASESGGDNHGETGTVRGVTASVSTRNTRAAASSTATEAAGTAPNESSESTGRSPTSTNDPSDAAPNQGGTPTTAQTAVDPDLIEARNRRWEELRRRMRRS